jgi:hypothetical protein
MAAAKAIAVGDTVVLVKPEPEQVGVKFEVKAIRDVGTDVDDNYVATYEYQLARTVDARGSLWFSADEVKKSK